MSSNGGSGSQSVKALQKCKALCNRLHWQRCVEAFLRPHIIRASANSTHKLCATGFNSANKNLG